MSVEPGKTGFAVKESDEQHTYADGGALALRQGLPMNLATQLCLGCCRIQEERDGWVAYTDARQREVLQRCEQRREALVSGEGEFAPGMGIVESRRRGRTL